MRWHPDRSCDDSDRCRFRALLALVVAASWVSCSSEQEPQRAQAFLSGMSEAQGWLTPQQSLAQETPEPPPASSSRAKPASLVMPADSRQAVLVTTDNWRSYQGRMRRFEREPEGTWTAVGEWVPVMIGRYGMAWGRGLHPEDRPGLRKVEGDMRTPAGVYDLGEARGYASTPPAGTTWPYHASGAQMRCDSSKWSSSYNTFVPTNGVILPSMHPGGATREQLFDLFILVKHNTHQVVRGAGSCVFLHVWAGPTVPTQGCVAMAHEQLALLLSWLRLEHRPVLVQLPEPELAQVRASWSLP